MFEQLLNKEIRAFKNRSKNPKFDKNIIALDEYFTYYVEYYQEATYWVLDMTTLTIFMLTASSPLSAVKQVHYTLKR